MSKKSWIFWSVIIDALLINLAIVLAFIIRFGGELPPFNFQAYSNLALFITAIQILALLVFDLYSLEEVQGSFDVFFNVVKAVSLGTIMIVALTFFTRLFSFPRSVFALSWIIAIIVLSGWRIVTARWFKVVWPHQKILIVGAMEAGQEILKELKIREGWGYEVAGLVNRNPDQVGTDIEGVEVLGTVQELVPIIRQKNIDKVIVASPIRHRELIEDLAKTDETHVKVEVIPELYEIFIGRVDHTLISDIPLVKLTRKQVPGWVIVVKRTLDLTFSFIALIVGLPLWLICALLVKITSSGPIFYTQERVGQKEKLFKIYKFRTMYKGAEKTSGPVLADENDPRITFIGSFLRRLRLDEVPNIINSRKGEMSFVGPRPERPEFVKEFVEKIPGYQERFKIKPGVTGLAQVSGTYATTARNKLKYDLIYAYNQSLFLDLKVIMQTIKIVLTGKGAR